MTDDYAKLIADARIEFATMPDWTMETRVVDALETLLGQNAALREAIEYLTAHSSYQEGFEAGRNSNRLGFIHDLVQVMDQAQAKVAKP